MKSTELDKSDNLLRVCNTIVYLKGKVGVFHLNKLAYLFEYLHIVNFGQRYSKEKFVKLPHGPVISDYKKHLTNLFNENYVLLDPLLLNKKRTLNSSNEKEIIPIFRTDKTNNCIINESHSLQLMYKIINDYGQKDVDELESIVYKTEPVKNLIISLKNSPFKKVNGCYVLESPNIKISEHRDRIPEWKKRALAHINKFPKIVDKKQMAEDYEEFKYLEKLRPAYE